MNWIALKSRALGWDAAQADRAGGIYLDDTEVKARSEELFPPGEWRVGVDMAKEWTAGYLAMRSVHSEPV